MGFENWLFQDMKAQARRVGNLEKQLEAEKRLLWDKFRAVMKQAPGSAAPEEAPEWEQKSLF